MSRKTEIQVGVTVLVALGILLWGVTWLKEFSLTRNLRVWHVAFPQAGGLGRSDEVLVNGMRKGQVQDIRLAGDHVVVDLALGADLHLTSDCRVAIRNIGLMGEKVIVVDLRTTGREYAKDDTIPGVFEMGMGEVMAGMGASLDAMDRVVHSLDGLAKRLDHNGDVDKTLENVRDASEQLAAAMKENRALLHETVENVNVMAKTAKELTTDREGQFKRTLDSVERSSKNVEDLSARLDSLRAVAQSVLNKADHGNGTAARLLNDDRLYEEAHAAIKAMRDLLEDFKKNPKKYINVHVL